MGFVQMCGLFGWCGIPLNPANMIVLPVILGIGVDHGVHLVHAWRQQRGRFALGDSTAVAVLLTATTTTASFGVLVLARHQGLQSLGQVLTLGVTTCLFSSIVFFPALLSWLTRSRPDETTPQLELHPESAVTRLPPMPAAEPDLTGGPPPAEDQLSEQIEDAVTALVLAATEPADVAEPEAEPAPLLEVAPAIPRRRTLPTIADVADGESSPPPHRGTSPLRHLAAVRQSER
jgi:hypothetical protein